MDLTLIETVKLTLMNGIQIRRNIGLVHLKIGLQKEMDYGVQVKCRIYTQMPVKMKSLDQLGTMAGWEVTHVE